MICRLFLYPIRIDFFLFCFFAISDARMSDFCSNGKGFMI